MSIRWKYFVRLFLSLFVFVFIISVNRNWIRIIGIEWISQYSTPENEPVTLVTTLLLVTGCCIVFYQFVQLALYIISLGKPANHLSHRFVNDGLFTASYRLYNERVSEMKQRYISLVVCGLLIFSFVYGISALRLFSNKETIFLTMPYFWDLHNRSVFGQYSGPEGYKRYLQDEPVRYFNFMTEDNNTDKYLRDLYTIARDLKDAGAKVVVADRPTGFYAGDKAMFKKIDSLGIVVWGEQSPHWSVKYYSKKEFTPLERFETHVGYSVENDPSKPVLFQRILRWYPFRKIAMSTRYQTESDIALWVAKKYFNMPDSVAPIVG
ncbi:MAG: hypothetical protein AB1600_12220, partial [Bacteroidota bacterium]